MSLRRVKRNSNGPIARRSMSDFSVSTKWMTKVESGIEDICNDESRNDLAADLRNIGNKYDKLVLKMFNQRSNLRGDLTLLKKDAQLLRNEMKSLIVKHDNATAFKKGYGKENHEKERVLKAEIVTKEMGQLELALADLMSKYYYLLQQTKTLKEINSLWHIRSVLKSDFLQLTSLKPETRDCVDVPSIKNSIFKKDSKEVKIESANLTQKLRWLTKLSHEFRNELQELRSAKMALLNGRSCLEKEYYKVESIDPIQESIPRSLDVNSISKDIRDAEVRIIDSLHDRIEALDKLSDAFKAVMVKAGFVGSETIARGEYDTKERKTFEVSTAIKYQNIPGSRNSRADVKDKEISSCSHEDSDNELEEVQVRYIRKESIEGTDLRCLQPGVNINHHGKNQRMNYVREKVNKYNYINEQINIQENGNSSVTLSTLGSFDINQLSSSEATSFQEDEFLEANESFTSAVTVWLRSEECALNERESEETIKGDVNNNEEAEELLLCKQIEKQFEDLEVDRRKSLRLKRNNKQPLVANDPASGHDAKVDQSTVDRFTKELSSILNKNLEECISSDDEDIAAKSSGNVLEDEDVSEHFILAKSSVLKTEEDGHAKMDVGTNAKVEEFGIKEIRGVSIENTVIDNKFHDEDSVVQDEEKTENDEKTATKANKGSNQAPNTKILSKSSELKERVMTPDDRPVFYDPAGTWQSTSISDTRFQRSRSALSRSNTLGRNMKLKGGSIIKANTDKGKQTASLRATTPNAFKTLPRGFKTHKENKTPASTNANDVIQRRKSSNAKEPSDHSCSTLPRKLKINSTSSKQSRPVSQIPRVSPDLTSSNKQTKEVSAEGKVNNRTPAQKKSATRPVSQFVTRDANLTKVDNKQRTRTKNPRPVSRIGSFKQGTNEAKIEVSPRRPVSRGSTYRPDSRSDNIRPTSRNGSVRQNNVSIYGTLPRVRRRVSEQKSERIIENEAKMAISSERCNQSPGERENHKGEIGKTSPSSETGNESRDPLRSSTPSIGSFVLINPEDIKCESDKGDVEINEVCRNNQGVIECQNKKKSLSGLDTEGATKKKHKILSIKKKKSKIDTESEVEMRKETTQDGGKKSKKTVSEKAASFMHNAFKLMSSESKGGAKNITKNNSCSESPVKKRPQRVGSYHENRKSFIPVPTLS